MLDPASSESERTFSLIIPKIHTFKPHVPFPAEHVWRLWTFCKDILYLQMQMFWGKQHLFEGPKGKTTQYSVDGMGTAVSNKQS